MKVYVAVPRPAQAPLETPSRHASVTAVRPSIPPGLALRRCQATETINIMNCPLHVRTTSPNAGFTLIEVLVVLAVLGLLAAAASPTFYDIVTARRLETASTQFVNAARLARAEAIKRSGVVSVRPLKGTDWGSGLAVRVETNLNTFASLGPLVRPGAPGLPAEVIEPLRQFTMPGRIAFPADMPAAFAFDDQGRPVALAPGSLPQEQTLALRVDARSQTISIARTGSMTVGPIQ
jgi:prepilin-type N-terminal cleavage/methylation domain-containing protein